MTNDEKLHAVLSIMAEVEDSDSLRRFLAGIGFYYRVSDDYDASKENNKAAAYPYHIADDGKLIRHFYEYCTASHLDKVCGELALQFGYVRDEMFSGVLSTNNIIKLFEERYSKEFFTNYYTEIKKEFNFAECFAEETNWDIIANIIELDRSIKTASKYNNDATGRVLYLIKLWYSCFAIRHAVKYMTVTTNARKQKIETPEATEEDQQQ